MKEIKRIILFGDSWVEGQGTYQKVVKDNEGIGFEEPILESNLLRKWRKNNSWNKFIKEKTKCKVVNYAFQGSGNHEQFKKLIEVFDKITPTDLILFGFTSKLRDDSFVKIFNLKENDKLLHENNPIKNNHAWEKISLDRYKYHTINKSLYLDKQEHEFTKKFIKDYFSFIYDEYPYEYLSQINYYFIQERIKNLGLNLVCFDLFEPYVDSKFTKKGYNVDKDIYITYGSQTMNDYLIEYEKNNISEDEISLWEDGKRRPDLSNEIFHPNQHGYELYINYLFDKKLKNQYKFIENV